MVDAGGASFRGTFGSNVGLKKKKSIGRKKKKNCLMVSLLSMLTAIHSDLTKCNNPNPKAYSKSAKNKLTSVTRFESCRENEK